MHARGPRGLLAVLAVMLWGVIGCGSRSMSPGYSSAGRGSVVTESTGGESDGDSSFELAPAEGPSDMRYAQGSADAAAPPQAAPPPPPSPSPAPTQNDGTTSKPPVEQGGPLLVYTANYTMAVYEVTTSIDNVQALAKKLGGYLVRRDDRAITIRVPAGAYRDALTGVSKLGDVLHHEETVEDVTEQFFDMKTRLDNARALRTRLQELLAAAKDVNDALSVEKELARVTETIEQMEGKLKRLRELINFSTITVRFDARGGENVNDAVNLPFPWLDQLGLGPLLQLR